MSSRAGKNRCVGGNSLKTKTVTFTKEQIQNETMRVNNALLKALKIEGTAVVRKKDGTISYSDPAKAGQFNEEVNNDS